MNGPARLEGLKNERGDPRPEKPKNVYQSGIEDPTIYLFAYLFIISGSRRTTVWAKPHPVWTRRRILSELHLTLSEMRRTLSRYATPFRVTPYPS